MKEAQPARGRAGPRGCGRRAAWRTDPAGVGGVSPERLVFLGSLAVGGEDLPIAYGDDPKRDMAGVLERIGPFRWRLVIPWPQSTSKLDVFELTPVAEQPNVPRRFLNGHQKNQKESGYFL